MHAENLHPKMYENRNCKVLLDYDPAILYEVETKVLNQSVKRTSKRFPPDLMFQLTIEEFRSLRSPIATLENHSRGKHRKYLPYAFTEQGIAMLSGILNSDIALNVNIAIMRTFVPRRKHALQHKDLNEKIKSMENKYDQQFGDIYEALHFLIGKNETRKLIGYK